MLLLLSPLGGGFVLNGLVRAERSMKQRESGAAICPKITIRTSWVESKSAVQFISISLTNKLMEISDIFENSSRFLLLSHFILFVLSNKFLFNEFTI